jgi:DNA processing protein
MIADYKIKEIKNSDADFPTELKNNNKYLEKFYYRGKWDKNIFEKTISIVGSRKMTRYGREIIDNFMPEIVANKITVISGFMYGVDSYAHESCIDLGGKTIAVCGWGLDFTANDENRKLYEKILKNDGLVMSEYENDFLPTLWSFPHRNKIVASLATEGVLVVEAGVKSGSLITARMAREMNKRVMTVSGNIFSETSKGTNYLIKNNLAEMIMDVGEILHKKADDKQIEMFDDVFTKEEKEIIEAIKSGENTIDEIVKRSGLKISVVGVNLSMMAMNNKIVEENGKYFVR